MSSAGAELLTRLQDTLRGGFFRRLAAYTASAGFAQGLLMVYALLVARHLGPQGFGQLMAPYALAGLTSIVITWGMDTWLLRASAQGRVEALSGQVLRVKLAVGLAWWALISLLAPLLRPDLFPPALTALAAADIGLEAMLLTMLASLNAQQRVGPLSRVLLLSRGGRLLSAVVLVLAGSQLTIAFAAGRVMFTLAALAAGLLAVRPQLRPSGAEGFGWVRQSMPYGLSEFFALLYLQADVTLLALLAGQQAVGLYSPASSIVNALFVIPNAAYTLFIPRLSQLEGDRPSFWLAGRKAYGWFAAIGVALAAAVALLGRPLLPFLLGEHYQPSALILLVLAPLVLFKALNFGSATLLVAAGEQQRRLAPQAVAALLNVAANLWAIPRYGILGAAWAYVFSELVLLAGYGWLVLRLRREEGAAA